MGLHISDIKLSVSSKSPQIHSVKHLKPFLTESGLFVYKIKCLDLLSVTLLTKCTKCSSGTLENCWAQVLCIVAPSEQVKLDKVSRKERRQIYLFWGEEDKMETESISLNEISLHIPAAQFQKNKWPNQNMGQRTKQTFLQRRHTDG